MDNTELTKYKYILVFGRDEPLSILAEKIIKQKLLLKGISIDNVLFDFRKKDDYDFTTEPKLGEYITGAQNIINGDLVLFIHILPTHLNTHKDRTDKMLQDRLYLEKQSIAVDLEDGQSFISSI